MLVLDLLWSGVNLLLSLTLATFEVHESDDVALSLEASFLNSALVWEHCSVEHETIDGVVDLLFNLRSAQKKD